MKKLVKIKIRSVEEREIEVDFPIFSKFDSTDGSIMHSMIDQDMNEITLYTDKVSGDIQLYVTICKDPTTTHIEERDLGLDKYACTAEEFYKACSGAIDTVGNIVSNSIGKREWK